MDIVLCHTQQHGPGLVHAKRYLPKVGVCLRGQYIPKILGPKAKFTSRERSCNGAEMKMHFETPAGTDIGTLFLPAENLPKVGDVRSVKGAKYRVTDVDVIKENEHAEIEAVAC